MSTDTFAKILEKNESKRQNRSKINTTIYLSQDSIKKAEFIAKHSDSRSGTEVISSVVSVAMLDFINTFRESVPKDKLRSFDKELMEVLTVEDFSRIYKITPENIIDYADVIILGANTELDDRTVISGKIVRNEKESFTFEYLDSKGLPQEKTLLKSNMNWYESEYCDGGHDSYIRFIKLKPIKESDSVIDAMKAGKCFSIDGYFCELWDSDYSDLGVDLSLVNAPFKQEEINGFVRNDNVITVTPHFLELTHVKDNQYTIDGHVLELFDSWTLETN